MKILLTFSLLNFCFVNVTFGKGRERFLGELKKGKKRKEIGKGRSGSFGRSKRLSKNIKTRIEKVAEDNQNKKQKGGVKQSKRSKGKK